MIFNVDEKVNEIALEKIDAKWLARFLSLTAVAVFLPFFIHLPWITGPIINAILILVLMLSGLRSALLVACLPSLMALSGGLLPVVLAPAVPLIIISNIIFVLAIDWFHQRAQSDFNGYWLGILSGAFLKFVFLFLATSFLAAFLIKSPVMDIITKLLGWSQLLTAVAGGVIAFGVLKFLKYFK
jgi:hypothetical protein